MEIYELMLDHADNRKILNPNDERGIARLAQQHFFFSDTRNERDQWGNTNLLNMYLGPGSSIKPLTSNCGHHLTVAHKKWINSICCRPSLHR